MGKNPEFYLNPILSSCWALLPFGPAEVMHTSDRKEQVEGTGQAPVVRLSYTLFPLQVLCNRLRSICRISGVSKDTCLVFLSNDCSHAGAGVFGSLSLLVKSNC